MVKQVLLDQRDGSVVVEEVPPPILRPGGILARLEASVISSGTERAKLEMGERSLVGKARSRPDLVRKVLDTARKDGVLQTAKLVTDRLGTPQALGYSASGIVEEVARDVEGVKPGDRVALAGAGYANHAEVVFVPATLTHKVPDGVPAADAAFATVGSIALHGIRQAELTSGELVIVVGLGLIGQLTVRILRAYGHPVIGVDLSPEARDEVTGLGVTIVAPDDPRLEVARADAVLLTAATASSAPIVDAPSWCRDRARVVVVGDVGLKLQRAPYYDNEVDLRFSRSYGPGRYDPAYEEGGNDYPVGYVRWTEQRNLGEFLRLLDEDLIKVDDLVTERFAVNDAAHAYDRLGAAERTRALLLTYDITNDAPRRRTVEVSTAKHLTASDAVDLIGAGNFATRVLLPHLKDQGLRLRTVVSASGTSAAGVAKTHGFVSASSAPLETAATSGAAAVIATRHSSHAELALAAAAEGRRVFLEKPLAITEGQLKDLREAPGRDAIMVGFNRRFSPAVTDVAAAVASRHGPLSTSIRVNAGQLPSDHWLMTPEEGGRIVGEVCHFVDLACHLTGSGVTRVFAAGGGAAPILEDRVHVTLSHADGSTTAITYVSNGSPRVPKERVELHWDGRTALIDDFTSWELSTERGSSRRKSRGQDKGHANEIEAFAGFTRGQRDNPVPFSQAAHVTAVTFAIVRSLESGSVEHLESDAWTV